MQYISFFTATILNWKHMLLDDRYKDIIISSMKFLVKEKRVVIYAFVIMPNHIHLVWKIAKDRKKEDVQRDFLKYTAQKMKLKLKDEDPDKLKLFYAGAKDREYQFTNYKYSSASFYYKENSEWDFLTHYTEAFFE